jgi:UDP-N-acetylglucosamine 4-epimerase
MKDVVKNRILITGGAGFIGSNLCEYFYKGHEVVCLDNFATDISTI